MAIPMQCVVCGRTSETASSPWREFDDLCLRCWRWAMLWMVGQSAAADGLVAKDDRNPF